MSLSSLLVDLDGGERSKVRLKVAVDLARARGAKITGLFLRTAAKAEAADASRAEFLAATARLDAEWIGVDGDDADEVLRRAIRIARHFDMIVLGQRRADEAPAEPDFAEELIAHSGRPVLVLPEAGEFKAIGKRPIFAWTDSPASARGLTDGVPLVMPRVEALVVGFFESGDPETPAVQAGLGQFRRGPSRRAQDLRPSGAAPLKRRPPDRRAARPRRGASRRSAGDTAPSAPPRARCSRT